MCDVLRITFGKMYTVLRKIEGVRRKVMFWVEWEGTGVQESVQESVQALQRRSEVEQMPVLTESVETVECDFHMSSKVPHQCPPLPLMHAVCTCT